ncbi:Cyclin [Handroanthus impetiginosus]|uniref:Cyclin n=1 Tax=Handroanthus impetiginosus TaxID=429701 RepID=A0A2G9HZ51_9LAMI|nr:Cyclin [Handroanthus impetiginosus]
MAEIETPQVMPNLITFLSSLFQRVADSNDFHHRFQTQKISAFHGLSRPTISIRSYLERIFKYANCSPSCYIVAYIYLDRFTQRRPDFAVNSFNVHRLLITGVMVSAKFMDDMYYNNAYYAKVGGISTREINFLEVDFLFGLGFHLNVTPTTFHTYCSYLQSEMLLYPHLNISQEPSLLYTAGRSSELHLYLIEEDSSHQHQQQLAF